MLLDAGRHLATAATAESAGDLAGGYQLAYDALRKSAASLLVAQGLRPTSRGGHVAVQEAVNAQFGTTVRVLRSFGRIRRARNSFEYPSSETPGPSADESGTRSRLPLKSVRLRRPSLTRTCSPPGSGDNQGGEASGLRPVEWPRSR